nr:hypothetical protein [Tanacetum cinerariifolium]
MYLTSKWAQSSSIYHFFNNKLIQIPKSQAQQTVVNRTNYIVRFIECKQANDHKHYLITQLNNTNSPQTLSSFRLTFGANSVIEEFERLEMVKDIQIYAKMRKKHRMIGVASFPKYGYPTLERFLINRSMDPKKAAKMFVEWQKWRSSFVPLGFIPDSEIPELLEQRKLFFSGFSKNGHPVVILSADKHYPAKDQDQYKSNTSLLRKKYFIKIDTRAHITNNETHLLFQLSGEQSREMLCQERGSSIEIADVVKGSGLTILKGVMKSRNRKIWAHFTVEDPCSFLGASMAM